MRADGQTDGRMDKRCQYVLFATMQMRLKIEFFLLFTATLVMTIEYMYPMR